MNKPVNPWIAAVVILLALGAALFLYLRPERRADGPAPSGMPPEAAAEMSRRMQEWQRRQKAPGSASSGAPVGQPGAAGK
jgi:hypothetical protein